MAEMPWLISEGTLRQVEDEIFVFLASRNL